MSDSNPSAIFLSYSRDDLPAARRIAEGLRAVGLEVWFDENELAGGDAWDQKIRAQIASCALFVPLISARTERRLEGYFRLEWRLAEQRSHLMAKGKRFLLPVCVDETREKGAQVPDAFLEVQWTRLAAGETTPQFVELVRRLVIPADVGESRAPAASAPSVAPRPAPVTSSRRGPLVLGLAVAAVLAVGVGVWSWRSISVGNGKAAPAATAEKSIAVLAFENVGGDRENEVFATGVPEEILMQLGRVAGLRLAGANSSFLLRGRPDAEVAQKLNVTHVVSGSVQRVGSQVKITARLVNAADGTQLWSDRFSEEMRNIFAAQEKIAGLIAEKLSLRLGGSSRAAKAIDPDAQRLVLEGRYHWNLRTFESFGRAEEAFRKAIALAPEFAEAHAGLAGVCMSRSNFSALEGLVPLAEDMPTARREAALALQLDPNLAEAHAALGMTHYLERDYALAEKSYQSALAANPQLALARMWYGLLLAGMGRFEPAEAQSRKGAELEPLWFMQFQIWGNICQHQGNFSRAAELLARAAALRSELYVSNLGSRVTVEYRLGHTESAVNLARQVRANFDVRPRGSAAPQAIYVLLKTGHAAEAEDYARQVMARLAPQSHLRGYVLVALGRIEEAWPYLSDMPTQELLKIARDPMFEPVRRDPRFSALAATLRIPQELLSSR